MMWIYGISLCIFLLHFSVVKYYFEVKPKTSEVDGKGILCFALV